MKIPGRVDIGTPAHVEPKVVARLTGHGLDNPVVGTTVVISSLDGDFPFRVDVAYTPLRGKRQSIRPLLVPLFDTDDPNFWNLSGVEPP